MSLPTPKLVDLDDPLGPRPAQPTAPPAKPRRPRTPRANTDSARAAAPAAPAQRSQATLADEKVVAVFARMPASVSDVLANTVSQLNAGRPRGSRISQQDVLGTLVYELRDPADTETLLVKVKAYRALTRPD